MKKLRITIYDTITTLDALVTETQKHIDDEPTESTKNTIRMAKSHIQQALVILETVASDKRDREMKDIQGGKTFKR